MLKARSSNGLIVLLSALTQQELDYARKNERFFCPICKKSVIVKAGKKVIPHFAHRSKTDCPSSGGEGPYHEIGKLMLYQWLKSQHLQVKLEPYLSEINQIPDIYLKLNNKNIAIEFQCAKVDIQSIQQRNIGYQKIGIIPIWLLGANQFKRLGQHQLQVNSFTQQFIHQFSSEYPRTLYYFCPDTFQIAIFQDMHFFRNTAAFGTFTFRKMNQIRFPDLFPTQHFPKLKVYHLWKREKKRFRLAGRHDVRGRARHWQQWLYLNHISIDHLPSIVYLPISSQYLMKTPLWDWQSRFSIDILHPLKIGERFSIKAGEYRLRPYIKSAFDYPLIPSYQSPIEEYVKLLEQLSIVKQISSHEYIKTKPIRFHSHIEDALIADISLMNKLSTQLNLNKKQA